MKSVNGHHSGDQLVKEIIANEIHIYIYIYIYILYYLDLI